MILKVSSLGIRRRESKLAFRHLEISSVENGTPQDGLGHSRSSTRIVVLLLVAVALFGLPTLIHTVFSATYQPPSNLNTYPAPAVPSCIVPQNTICMLI